MLTLTPLSGAARAAQYYLVDEQEKTGQARAGYWLGKLAKEAGLWRQKVEPKCFLEALRGQVQGEATVGRRGQHAPGLDVTFSAPKSLSLLALLGGDQRLRQAHERAVHYALTALEREAAQARVQSQGQLSYVETGSLLIAVFEHTTSRAHDPQLHSHAVITNLTRVAQGPLRALASCTRQRSSVLNGTFERLFAHQKYYSALYHGHLAKSVTALGYRLEPQPSGAFDIVGVPRSVIEAFSVRRAQIQQWQRARGWDSPSARDIAALCTRVEKATEHSVNPLPEWQSRLVALGYTPEQLLDAARRGPPRVPLPMINEANRAVTLAIGHLTRYQTAMSMEHLVQVALDRFNDQPSLTVQAVKNAVEQRIKDKQLIALPTQGHYTTAELLHQELSLLACVRRRHKVPGQRPHPHLFESRHLSAAQRMCLTTLIRSTRPFHVIDVQGEPGALNDHVLDALRVSGLGSHVVFSRRRDIRQWWTRHSASPRSRQWLQRLSSITPTILHQFLAAPPPLRRGEVVVVDDARQLNVEQLRRLCDIVTQSQNKLILLNRHTRQPSAWARNALALFRCGHVSTYGWQSQEQRPSKVVLTGEEDRSLTSRLLDAALDPRWEIRTASRRTHADLTHRVRELLRVHGHLSGPSFSLLADVCQWLSPSEQRLAKYYQPGMRLRYRYHDRWVLGHVLTVDRQHNFIELLTGKGKVPVRLDLTSEAASLSAQVWVSHPLNITKGERLIATQNEPNIGLEEGLTYRVVKCSPTVCVLKGPDGGVHRLSDLTRSSWPLTYHYLAGPSDRHPKPYLLFVAPAYTLSKTLLEPLCARYRRIDLHTDDRALAHQRLEHADVRPCAIERLLSPHPTIDRYLDRTAATDIERDVKQALHLVAPLANASVAKQAVAFALHHCATTQAAFRQRTLVIESIRFALAESREGLTLNDILAELDGQRTLLSRAFQDGTRWTTDRALAQERAILSHLQTQRDTQPPLTPPSALEALLSTRPQLTPGQRQALSLITTSRDRFVAVQGLAGTGKSTLLKEVLQLVREAQSDITQPPKQLLGLAPTRSAVRELKRQGLPATTLAQCLARYRDRRTSSATFCRSLFFLDECAMLGNPQLLTFLRLVIDSNSRAVLLGDRHQLLALEAGKPFALAIERGWIETAYLHDIVRQRTPNLRRAVQHFVDGQPGSAIHCLSKQAPDPATRAPTIVSTHDLMPSEDKANPSLYQQLVDDFLSRTPDTRRQTLIIAHTHVERDAIATVMRAARRERGELPDQSVPTPRLRAINTTPAERGTMMPYQPGRVLSLHPNHYETIAEVDPTTGIVTLASSTPDAPRVVLPLERDHTHTELYTLSHPSLSVNDWIVFRQATRGDPWCSNERYVVERISTTGIQLRSERGQRVAFNPFELAQAHWDYDYTRTADMAQGMTVDCVLSVVRSQGALTSLRRAYVDVSRARDRVCLYTDAPEALVNTWLSRPCEAFSALDTIDGTIPARTVYFNELPNLADDPRFHTALGEYDVRRLEAHLNHALPRYTESLATQLFGCPDPERSTPQWLVFGPRDRPTLVCVSGPKRGHITDTQTGRTHSLLSTLAQRARLPHDAFLAHMHDTFCRGLPPTITAHPNHDAYINQPTPAWPRWTPSLPAQTSEAVEPNDPWWECWAPVPTVDRDLLHDIDRDTLQRALSPPALEVLPTEPTRNNH
ncbi:conjugative transfer relaxase/helicase TraI [Vibrio coralliilyticus]|uniref:AAA+ ATPase domain-containing protein n=1 Tax=Vibrio coralliilyticus TaxID=190893 RepID=A0AAN0SLD5_9VIBR|nr:conjugative transfer relaxase/helicase TraI [Vibrio coralliilyticus]AIW22907.1 hypothetical protein IX92_28130 [Vibrio coralliilyticus]NOH38335.1 conjugative transfer relaxase/helicase TraI [Vibrio coralliilyticus]NOH55242.1 conjugative transfer relaxase/helicase TraI [Vibrio coralliilyticus]